MVVRRAATVPMWLEHLVVLQRHHQTHSTVAVAVRVGVLQFPHSHLVQSHMVGVVAEQAIHILAAHMAVMVVQDF
jgi:hypothetical protein